MPRRPVCVRCGETMIQDRSVTAIEKQFRDKQIPYRIYQADLFKCGKCGAEILGGWGKALEQFNEGFNTARARAVYDPETIWFY